VSLTVIEHRKGHVYRIVETLGMGYIADAENDRLWPFLFSQVKGYSGQEIEKLGLVGMAPVSFLLEQGKLIQITFRVSDKTMAYSGAK